MSDLSITGTPNIGDIGRVVSSDTPQVAVGIAAGYEIAPRISLELRYTHLGELTVAKVSPYPTVFPLQPGEVAALVISRYDFTQRTDLLAAALPCRIWANGKLSLQLTPILEVEFAEVELSRPPLPNVIYLAGASPVFYRRSTTTLQAAAEIAVSYRLTDTTAVELHYTYSPLSNFDAHLFGAGLQVKF